MGTKHRKPQRSGARLTTWYVSLRGEWVTTWRQQDNTPWHATRKSSRWIRDRVWRPIVCVSRSGGQFKIRTISARAAARHYIRHNLAFDIASMALETDNQCGQHYMDLKPADVKRFGGEYVKTARIEIVRD